MIHQVFLDAMNHNFFDLAKVNLLVVDECHHAVGKSPYAQIFQIYKERKVDILLLYISPLANSLSDSRYWLVHQPQSRPG